MPSPDNLYEQLIERVTEFTGSEPVGLRRYLKLLAHPEVIGTTKAYFDSVDYASMCTQYGHPWNCVREAEANFQNVKHGWTGAPGGLGQGDEWCENCRAKIFGPAFDLMNAEETRESIGFLLRGEHEEN